jgi:hypothetical protein
VALGSYIGVSDYAIKDWYAKWKVDNNTTLERFVPNIPKEKIEDLKFDYYEKLATGVRLTEFEAAIKYKVARGIVKGWKTEYKKNGGVFTRNYRITKKIHVPTAVEQPKPEEEKSQHVEPQENLEKVAENLHVNGNSIDVLDTFFESMGKIKDRIQSSEKEVDFYKQKCEKWATRIVELQAELARR